MSLPKTLFAIVSAGEYSESLLFSLSLTRSLAEYLLKKMDMAQKIAAVDPEFDSLVFWTSAPDAWMTWDGEVEAGEEEAEIYGDWFESERIRLVEMARTEVERLHVYPSAVYWSASRKHSSDVYETFYLGRTNLENLLTTLAEDLAKDTETP